MQHDRTHLAVAPVARRPMSPQEVAAAAVLAAEAFREARSTARVLAAENRVLRARLADRRAVVAR